MGLSESERNYHITKLIDYFDRRNSDTAYDNKVRFLEESLNIDPTIIKYLKDTNMTKTKLYSIVEDLR